MTFRSLYPQVDPRISGWLEVGDGQELYWEEYGSPDGKPALFLHGGPGGGLLPNNHCWFDPAAYRIVLFDQRNCGRSRPHASDPKVSLDHNTTAHLTADIEALREHLGVDRWLLFGGSWGSTLALAYAQAFPDRVTEMVLRGIYLARPSDLTWAFTPSGAARLFPAEWSHFCAPIPEDERDDLLAAYGRRLTDPNTDVLLPAARAWVAWEIVASTLLPVSLPDFDDDLVVAFARITHHYFEHGCFLPPEGLLAAIDRIRHIPCVIVNGRYDMKTTASSAYDLHQAWPEAEFHIVEDAGHAAAEPGTRHLLLEATDRFRSLP